MKVIILTGLIISVFLSGCSITEMAVRKPKAVNSYKIIMDDNINIKS